MRIGAIIFFVFLVFSPMVSAQILEQNQLQQSRLSGFTLASFTSNMKKQDLPDDFAQTSVNNIINYSLDGGHQLRTALGFTKDHHGEEETHLIDSYIAWRKATPWKKLFIIQDVRLTIPLSEESNKNQDLLTSLAYRPLVVYGLGDIGWKGASLIYIPIFRRNFHSFNTTMTGRSNNEYSISHIALVEFGFLSKFRANFGGTYSNAWTYKGVRNTDTFSFFQEVGYQVTKKATINIGHTNQGQIYGPNGIDNNVSLFDDDSNLYYVSMMLNF